MQLIVAGLVAVPLLWLIWRFDPFRVRRRFALAVLAATTALIVGDVGRSARAGMGAVPGRQSYLQSRALGRGGGVAAGFDRMDRGRSAGERPASPRAGRARRRPVRRCRPARTATPRPSGRTSSCCSTSRASTSPRRPASRCRPGYSDYFKSIDGKQRTMIAESTGGPTWYTEFNVLTGMSARSFGDLKFYVTRITAGRVDARTAAGAAALRLQDRLALSDLWRLPQRARLPEGRRRRAVHRHGGHGRRMRTCSPTSSTSIRP